MPFVIFLSLDIKTIWTYSFVLSLFTMPMNKSFYIGEGNEGKTFDYVKLVFYTIVMKVFISI